MTHLYHYASYDEMSMVAKNIFVDAINKAIKRKKKAVVAIPGGRSVRGMLSLLQQNDVDWAKVHLFMIDERLVPITHKDSNFRQAKELFIHNILGINAHAYDPSIPLNEYTDDFKEHGTFDVVLLAAGEDCHIAALYPQHHSITHQGKEYFSMQDSPKPPAERMTASPEIIKEAHTIILLFASPEKKNAFEKFSDKTVSEQDCPAKIVKQAKEVYVLTALT